MSRIHGEELFRQQIDLGLETSDSINRVRVTVARVRSYLKAALKGHESRDFVLPTPEIVRDEFAAAMDMVRLALQEAAFADNLLYDTDCGVLELTGGLIDDGGELVDRLQHDLGGTALARQHIAVAGEVADEM